ncbi:GNAT family N-acetyltransferase [Streptomyces sp. TG1A-8]|uniref:GNAT family N-acetyltransferase n=1 Tax=Streptomyces sp. TG1A-8 TaxID=3051385 RepID=UPI00265BB980|nr:GNAT family N-acetyltransferase [Streptomyces sp. TG1A-8]MDO0924223.1 GNAT family N-acetyltransferase [Streptomyces sp. TG1A-8]
MRVSLHSTSRQLPAGDWDSLTVDATIYSSSGFLKVREEELPEGAHGHYLLARDAGGAAVSGLEAYSFRTPPHVLYTPADLLTGLVPGERHHRVATNPLAFGSGWSEFRGQLPRRADVSAADREAAVRALTAEAMRFAGANGASVLAYYYLPREQALEVARAHAGDGAVVRFHDVETSLPLGLWDTFDDYRAWLPARRRQRALRELRLFQESDRIVKEYRLPEAVKEMAPLNSALMQRHGHTAFDEERVATVYERQGRFLGDQSSLLMAEDAGRPVGCVLRYRQHDMLYGRVAGFDYSASNLADYFNLVFYHPITTGAGRSVRAIHLGLGTFHAKMSRGAQPTPLYSVLVGVDRPLDADAAAVRERNRSEVLAFAEEHGPTVVGGIDAESWMLD